MIKKTKENPKEVKEKVQRQLDFQEDSERNKNDISQIKQNSEQDLHMNSQEQVKDHEIKNDATIIESKEDVKQECPLKTGDQIQNLQTNVSDEDSKGKEQNEKGEQETQHQSNTQELNTQESLQNEIMELKQKLQDHENTSFNNFYANATPEQKQEYLIKKTRENVDLKTEILKIEKKRKLDATTFEYQMKSVKSKAEDPKTPSIDRLNSHCLTPFTNTSTSSTSASKSSSSSSLHAITESTSTLTQELQEKNQILEDQILDLQMKEAETSSSVAHMMKQNQQLIAQLEEIIDAMPIVNITPSQELRPKYNHFRLMYTQLQVTHKYLQVQVGIQKLATNLRTNQDDLMESQSTISMIEENTTFIKAILDKIPDGAKLSPIPRALKMRNLYCEEMTKQCHNQATTHTIVSHGTIWFQRVKESVADNISKSAFYV